jgi:hypothetical protein
MVNVGLFNNIFEEHLITCDFESRLHNFRSSDFGFLIGVLLEYDSDLLIGIFEFIHEFLSLLSVENVLRIKFKIGDVVLN